jgi:hypothetical protein
MNQSSVAHGAFLPRRRTMDPGAEECVSLRGIVARNNRKICELAIASLEDVQINERHNHFRA